MPQQAQIPGMPQVNPNDMNAIIEFAIGPLDVASGLKGQKKGSLPEIHGLYFGENHTYVIKKAGIGGRDDWRCFDAHTGRMVYNSHHPGKDPYAAADPLGLNNGPPGGEWESVCDVSGYRGGFKVRPKKMSMHGRQYVKVNDKEILSVAKLSKMKTMSLAKTFEVTAESAGLMAMGTGSGVKSEGQILTIQSDLAARTLQFVNTNGELVAIAQKPPKTLFLNVALGVGSEMQLEVAPGVDCSVILAAFLALQQSGEHILKDALGNFVVDPMKDEAVGQAADLVPGGNEAIQQYTQLSGQGKHAIHHFNKIAKLLKQ